MLYADAVRNIRQKEYDNTDLYSDAENLLAEQKEKAKEDFKLFLLAAPLGGGKKGTISRNTVGMYFSIFKAAMKQVRMNIQPAFSFGSALDLEF